MSRLTRISLQSDCPAWGNLTWPKEGEFHLANGVPCNEYFEDHCTSDVRTALGVYVKKHCADFAATFALEIGRECKKQFGAGVQQQKTKEESRESYGPGRAILIADPSGNTAGICLISTTTQRAGQGLAARISYVFNGVQELFELLADRRINEVVMPVLGAGHGGIEPSLALAGLVLALAEAAKYGCDSQRRKKITIVVFQRTRQTAPDVEGNIIRRALELVANPALRR